MPARTMKLCKMEPEILDNQHTWDEIERTGLEFSDQKTITPQCLVPMLLARGMRSAVLAELHKTNHLLIIVIL